MTHLTSSLWRVPPLTSIGGSPVLPTLPGDTLNVNLAGTTGQSFTPGVAGAGVVTFTNRSPVNLYEYRNLAVHCPADHFHRGRFARGGQRRPNAFWFQHQSFRSRALRPLPLPSTRRTARRLHLRITRRRSSATRLPLIRAR